MAEQPKPPEDITPDDFYLKWLPEQSASADPAQKAKVKDINAVIQVVLTGEGGGEYYMELASGDFKTAKGKADSPNLTITQAVEDWREINAGRLNAQMAFMSGKIKISGDMSLAMKLQAIMGS
jgi:putative sterol carrier protein